MSRTCKRIRLVTCLLMLGFAYPVMAWAPPDYEAVPTVTQTTVAVATTTTVTLAAKGNRTFVVLQNISDTNIDCSIGKAAVLSEGIRLYANGGNIILDKKYPLGAINCIHGGAATKSLLVTEGS